MQRHLLLVLSLGRVLALCLEMRVAPRRVCVSVFSVSVRSVSVRSVLGGRLKRRVLALRPVRVAPRESVHVSVCAVCVSVRGVREVGL